MSGCDSGEGSSQSEPSQFEWELCRENVKPLKSGRRVEAINQALAHAAYGPKAETLANQKFDEIMELCEASRDPLKHCLDFCTWFEQTFPHGRQRLFYSLLWKIVHKYAKWPVYLEDERMVRIWEKLADNSLGHGWEIYQHANSIGSLLRCAQLYIRWSQDLEMRGAIADARAVLNRARKHGALPLAAIDDEEDQLEMREMRRHLEGDGHNDMSWEEDECDENGERVAFTRLTAMGDSTAAPVVRLPCIVGEQGSSKLDRGQSKQRPVNNGVAEFQVFEDEEDGTDNYLEGIYEVNNHIERFSLNDPSAEKWKASKVPLKKLGNCVSTFTVYQDDDKENTDPQTNQVVKKPILKLRKCLIRDMSIEENLARMFESKGIMQDAKQVARKINFDDDDDE
ncbi:hypothetical protein ANCCAN_10269 [Ancylostoma caninum]|uniref:BUB1 N-terminal domain-containing protein n=1 Tax=Ancylostoma caninum TaxID=29170 RepID=A0A368GL38_ANCCA|nr:hypothetical protein ANCCAN_10269 [Ancylostoma caninum]